MMLADVERADASAPHSQAAAEAARYALLRRLAPSMRHHLVVNLQPIGMIYEVMDRRLKAPHPDLANVHESAHKINGFARAALQSCLDAVSWLAPEEGITIAVAEGVRECSSLLATSLGFRGYPLRTDAGQVQEQVRRSAIRNLLTAALLHLTDKHAPPAELLLTAERLARGAQLVLELRPSASDDKGFASEPGYRGIEWSDVEALAASEGVEAQQDGARVTLVIPWA